MIDTLAALESEAVHLIREVTATTARPVLLFSGGKDSAVLAHLAVKAFAPAAVPFPMLHVDTGHNFPEVVAFRDDTAARLGMRLHVASVPDAIAAGLVEDAPSRNRAQTPVLLAAIREHGWTAAFGGARRDEDPARAKERYVSVRAADGSWDPLHQHPEPWGHINTSTPDGWHARAFPMSDWTEIDVWRYVQQEDIPLPSLYFAHARPVVDRGGRLFSLIPGNPTTAGETAVWRTVRFRTVGDATCTTATLSSARTVGDVLAELESATVSERGSSRADDDGPAAMEDRKRAGYF